MKKEKFQMIAKTFQQLEDVLAEELIGLGADNVEIGNRMVSFEGDLAMLYKANLCCRTALRILKPIYNFTASCTDEVYDKIKEIKWDDFLAPDQTFSIDSTVYSDDFRHSKFVTYRVKDAIVDYFNDKYQQRPSVRMNKADLILNLHISNQNCTLSIDSSGEPLYKRGYRVDQTEAPLNEVLAAGMILKTGWKGESNFIDPMCGSGTLLIEAAMIACNIAPGVYRHDYAFERWKDFDEELFDSLYNDDSTEKEFNFKIYGSDISPRAIQIAEENIKSAGLSRYIDLSVLPVQRYETAPEKGILITNPPYGERISSDDLLGLYQMLGERLKHVFKGYDAWIISYREECFEKIGLKPAVKIDLMNGSLECQYRKYEIFDGKYRDFKEEGGTFREREREKSDFKRVSPKRDGNDSRSRFSDAPYLKRERRDERSDRYSKPDDRFRKRDGKPDFDRNRDERSGERSNRYSKPDDRFRKRDGKPDFNRTRGERPERNDRDRKPFSGERRERDKPFFKKDGPARSFDRSEGGFKKRSFTDSDSRMPDTRNDLSREERIARSRFTITDGKEKFVSFRKPSIPDPAKKESKRERFKRPKDETENGGE